MNGSRFDYASFKSSILYNNYIEAAERLQTADLRELDYPSRLSFFLNLYNGMVLHGNILRPRSSYLYGGSYRWYNDINYIISGLVYSLTDIENGVLRRNERPAYGVTRCFGDGDDKGPFAYVEYLEERIHFGINRGTCSCPRLRFYTAEGILEELEESAKVFIQATTLCTESSDEVEVSKIFHWYEDDFTKGFSSVQSYLLRYLEDNSQVKDRLRQYECRIVFSSYDWTTNNI